MYSGPRVPAGNLTGPPDSDPTSLSYRITFFPSWPVPLFLGIRRPGRDEEWRGRGKSFSGVDSLEVKREKLPFLIRYKRDLKENRDLQTMR